MLGKMLIAGFAAITVAFQTTRATNDIVKLGENQTKASYEDFIHNATFQASAEDKGFEFGSEDNKWKVVASFSGDTVSIYDGTEVIKTANYDFNDGSSYDFSLIVNDDIARLYVDGGNAPKTAAITCKLDGFAGGAVPEIIGTGSNIVLIDNNQYAGYFYCPGYQISKIVNLSDNNYKLKTSDYSWDNGKFSIKDKYLKTLGEDTDYKFRIVTSFTDFTYNVHTSFDGVTASSVEKVYRENDLVIDIDNDVTVYKVEIDGSIIDDDKYDADGNIVTIYAEQLNSYSSGKHEVKVYTNNGRPEIEFSLEELIINGDDDVETATHLFFFIDIAIFAVLILGYAGFAAFKKIKVEVAK